MPPSQPPTTKPPPGPSSARAAAVTVSLPVHAVDPPQPHGDTLASLQALNAVLVSDRRAAAAAATATATADVSTASKSVGTVPSSHQWPSTLPPGNEVASLDSLLRAAFRGPGSVVSEPSTAPSLPPSGDDDADTGDSRPWHSRVPSATTTPGRGSARGGSLVDAVGSSAHSDDGGGDDDDDGYLSSPPSIPRQGDLSSVLSALASLSPAYFGPAASGTKQQRARAAGRGARPTLPHHGHGVHSSGGGVVGVAGVGVGGVVDGVARDHGGFGTGGDGDWGASQPRHDLDASVSSQSAALSAEYGSMQQHQVEKHFSTRFHRTIKI